MGLNHFTLKIGGPAGYGIKVTGLMFGKMCFHGGLNVFDYTEYPSLIRGGHNTYTVSASSEKIYTVDEGVDILLALDAETINAHHNELTKGAGVLYDSEHVHFDTKICAEPSVYCFPVPLRKLVTSQGATKQMVNVAALGATCSIIGYDISVLLSLINNQFKRKGEEIVRLNQKAAKAAYNYAKEHFKDSFPHRLQKVGTAGKRLYITGNEAIALGAIAGGMKCYVAYPMTPASSILHFMAGNEQRYGLVVKQAEDELAVINMAIGASQAGARTMLATSGGGFSLMVEALGLAAITETPLVIVNVQRPGPSTGLPTWTEQGDILFLAHASQGDFPRIILAPGDPEEAFYLTARAHNLAEKYQLQVIILSDKHLGESNFGVPYFDGEKINIERGKLLSDDELAKTDPYLRYKITEDGVSPRSIPGQAGGIFLANSDEHDEYGFSEESAENRIKMVDKRFRKLIKAQKEVPKAKLYGPKKAKMTFISCGSTRNAVLEAMAIMAGEGKKDINFLQIYSLIPFVDEKILEKILIDKKNKSVIVENNKTGQLACLIKQEIGLSSDYKLLKYDGRQFFPSEIVKAVKELK